MKKLFLLTLIFFTAQLGFSISQIEKQENSTKQIASLELNKAISSQSSMSQIQNTPLLNISSPSMESDSSESSSFVNAILIVSLIGLVLLISTTIYLGKKMIDKIV